MVSVTMATSEWIQFFKDAGIPPGPAVSYAVTFVDNRIQKNMLLDLNKELMNELGVTVVGDIIAILKHAKVVYRQEMCRAATELLHPGAPDTQSELRRGANSAASRMIANSLSRDSPPAAAPRPRPPAAKISVTVSNKLGAAKAEESPAVPVKRRRVTAEMEGKYIITMPKGTTPRTKKILEQQAAKGPPRTSVFDRLGAEAKGDAAAGGKPTGVFSRLGGAAAAAAGAAASESDDDSSVLQYAGVLKKLGRPFRKDGVEPGGHRAAPSDAAAAERFGIPPLPKPRRANMDAATAAPRGDGVAADKTPPEFRVTIKRIWGCGKLGGGSGGGDGGPAAQMDNAGSVSVFKRLGKKPD